MKTICEIKTTLYFERISLNTVKEDCFCDRSGKECGNNLGCFLQVRLYVTKFAQTFEVGLKARSVALNFIYFCHFIGHYQGTEVAALSYNVICERMHDLRSKNKKARRTPNNCVSSAPSNIVGAQKAAPRRGQLRKQASAWNGRALASAGIPYRGSVGCAEGMRPLKVPINNNTRIQAHHLQCSASTVSTPPLSHLRNVMVPLLFRTEQLASTCAFPVFDPLEFADDASQEPFTSF